MILSYESYLALEADSDIKYEYHDGFIVAMAGGSPNHSLIGANFIFSANSVLLNKGKDCIVYNSDLKIHISSSNRTYYPDASIVCEKPSISTKDKNAIINPLLIVEVLSESTASFDRGNKFTNYREIKSLREYVLISQTEAIVDTYYRTEDGTWEITTIAGLDGVILLKSIDCKIRLIDIYRLVEGIK